MAKEKQTQEEYIEEAYKKLTEAITVKNLDNAIQSIYDDETKNYETKVKMNNNNLKSLLPKDTSSQKEFIQSETGITEESKEELSNHFKNANDIVGEDALTTNVMNIEITDVQVTVKEDPKNYYMVDFEDDDTEYYQYNLNYNDGVSGFFNSTGQSIKKSGLGGMIDSLSSDGIEGLNSFMTNQSMGANKESNSLFNKIISGFKNNSFIGKLITHGENLIGTGLRSLMDYNDGSTETGFGQRQETTWRNFVNAVKESSYSNNPVLKHKVNFIGSTPLNSKSSSLYGTMILGAAPTQTAITDPFNRATINTIVKDTKILSLTPGLPKYNGSKYDAFSNVKADYMNYSPDEALDYLLKNGIDAENISKDKRYYTFKPEYGKFFSYLETMLNAVWVKLGLAETEDNEFNLMTFFRNPAATDGRDPKSQYCSALGFVVNPTGSVQENITNMETGIGRSLASEANNMSESMRELNYFTGFGGNSYKNLGRKTSMVTEMGSKLFNSFKGSLDNTIGLYSKGKNVASKMLLGGAGLALDAANFATKELGSSVQSFAVTNGMTVMYPELWESGSFSRTLSFDFNFVSPYGDPLSIFKYVYVPFLTLLCFTLPRQADDNGFVSPFFVRADLPGMVTCDLGFISSLSFTRGGSNGLFTADGLPRAISGTFNIEDLYQYLAMSRRLSFLEANPSYTSFLDSFVGLNAIYSDNNTSALNEYWHNMLNRVNGSFNGGLWNRFDRYGRSLNNNILRTPPENKFNIKPRSINWFNTTNG